MLPIQIGELVLGNEKYKIIVIDDSKVIRGMFSEYLSPLGVQVLECRDGAEGLRCLEENSDALILFTDINMPEKDGIDVIKEIREASDKYNNDVPIIIMTSEKSKQLKSMMHKLDIKGWLEKPFDSEKLRLLYEHFVEDRTKNVS